MTKYVVLALLIAFFSLAGKVAIDDARAFEQNEARAYAEQLVLASGAVRNFVSSGNAITSEVAANDLPKPGWMTFPSSIRVRADGGAAFVYLAAESSAEAEGVVEALEKRGGKWQGFTAGRNDGGNLKRQRPGAPPLPLPSWMPANAVVVVL